jgi:hypothetical protein
LILYSKLVPVGAVTTIVPVTIQVGCTITLAVGAVGAVGTAFIVATVTVEIQPVVVFFAVTLYVLEVSPEKIKAV